MAHGQSIVDFLSLLQKAAPEGLCMADIIKVIPSMKSNSGRYGIVKEGYVEQIKQGGGPLRRDIFKITPKGCKLLDFYESNPDKIMKQRTYNKKDKSPVIEPQLYHDPVAQKYIEEMARPVAWSSSLGSTLRDIHRLSHNILETEDIPAGDSALDKHNNSLLLQIKKIDKLAKPKNEGV